MNIDALVGHTLSGPSTRAERSDLMIKRADPDRMVLGNSLTNDGWTGKRFDCMLANPPYGVAWKAYADPIKKESDKFGFQGRFGAGLPRISDGSFLFLQHILSKMKPVADDPKRPSVDRRGLHYPLTAGNHYPDLATGRGKSMSNPGDVR